jgi:hypothetical protein
MQNDDTLYNKCIKNVAKNYLLFKSELEHLSAEVQKDVRQEFDTKYQIIDGKVVEKPKPNPIDASSWFDNKNCLRLGY